MPEGTSEGTPTGTTTGTSTGTGTGAPAWIAQLPTDLKNNEALTSYQTIGDLAKAHLETEGKLKDFDGMKARLEGSIPKLPENATDEQRNQYYDALGRPKQPSDYHVDGEDKNAPEWNSSYKQAFHAAGLTTAQASQIGKWWNGQMQQMVEKHNASLQTEMTTAEANLKAEWGDKYVTNTELAQRMTQKQLGTEFDKTFDNLSGKDRFQVVRLLYKFAALTGEDSSPQGGNTVSRQAGANPYGFDYSKSNMPPAKTA